MAKFNDYRKALAMIAPSLVGPGAEVWVSEQGFHRLLQLIDIAAVLDLDVEIQSAIESHGNLNLQIKAGSTGAIQVACLIQTVVVV